MGQWASCLTGGTLCLALPCGGRAAGAPPQMSPHLGQSLCAGDGYEHSVPARPCVCGGGGGGTRPRYLIVCGGGGRCSSCGTVHCRCGTRAAGGPPTIVAERAAEGLPTVAAKSSRGTAHRRCIGGGRPIRFRTRLQQRWDRPPSLRCRGHWVSNIRHPCCQQGEVDHSATARHTLRGRPQGVGCECECVCVCVSSLCVLLEGVGGGRSTLNSL